MMIDMEKILFNSLEKETYDSLLIDFIDWRFGIDQIKNEPRLTLSAKLFKTKPDCIGIY